MMSNQMECQPKLLKFFTLYFKIWKYLLLITNSSVSFCFTLAFTPLIVLPSYGIQSNNLHNGQVDWFLCGGSTGTINGIISVILDSSHNFLELHLALPKKKNQEKNRLSQTPYPHNGQGLLIKTRVFCWCSLITVLYLFQKKKIVTV